MELVSFDKLAEMLRKKRQRIGVKQKKVANRAGLSPSQVNRVEKKSVNPSYESVYKLWKTLEELEDREVEKAEDLMNEQVTWARPDETLEEVSGKMRENQFSQLPVSNGSEQNIGRVTETRIIESGDPDKTVEEVMGPKFLEVVTSTEVDVVREILREDPAVLVQDEEHEIVGIITKADLI